MSDIIPPDATLVATNHQQISVVASPTHNTQWSSQDDVSSNPSPNANKAAPEFAQGETKKNSQASITALPNLHSPSTDKTIPVYDVRRSIKRYVPKGLPRFFLGANTLLRRPSGAELFKEHIIANLTPLPTPPASLKSCLKGSSTSSSLQTTWSISSERANRRAYINTDMNQIRVFENPPHEFMTSWDSLPEELRKIRLARRKMEKEAAEAAEAKKNVASSKEGPSSQSSAEETEEQGGALRRTRSLTSIFSRDHSSRVTDREGGRDDETFEEYCARRGVRDSRDFGRGGDEEFSDSDSSSSSFSWEEEGLEDVELEGDDLEGEDQVVAAGVTEQQSVNSNADVVENNNVANAEGSVARAETSNASVAKTARRNTDDSFKVTVTSGPVAQMNIIEEEDEDEEEVPNGSSVITNNSSDMCDNSRLTTPDDIQEETSSIFSGETGESDYVSACEYQSDEDEIDLADFPSVPVNDSILTVLSDHINHEAVVAERRIQELKSESTEEGTNNNNNNNNNNNKKDIEAGSLKAGNKLMAIAEDDEEEESIEANTNQNCDAAIAIEKAADACAETNKRVDKDFTPIEFIKLKPSWFTRFKKALCVSGETLDY